MDALYFDGWVNHASDPKQEEYVFFLPLNSHLILCFVSYKLINIGYVDFQSTKLYIMTNLIAW